jgi:hypothetical protein
MASAYVRMKNLPVDPSHQREKDPNGSCYDLGNHHSSRRASNLGRAVGGIFVYPEFALGFSYTHVVGLNPTQRCRNLRRLLSSTES